MFDATALWGKSNGALAGQSLAGSQDAVSARARGNWSFRDVKFAPAVSIAHGMEVAGPGAGGSTIEKSTVTVAPRLSRPYSLEGGRMLEPFITYKSEIDVGTVQLGTTGGGADTVNSAGGGVTLAKPDAYSFSLTTDIEAIGQTERPNVRSQLQLKVPLKEISRDTGPDGLRHFSAKAMALALGRRPMRA